MREPMLVAISWIVGGGAVWLVLMVVPIVFLWAATRRTRHLEQHYDEFLAELRESHAESSQHDWERSAAL